MKRWSIRFKDRQPDAAEMTFLAKEFYRDLMEENVTIEEFTFADRQVCKVNRFFPVMADLLVFVKQHREEENIRETARGKWRRDNEWKKTFPELLTRAEREELGVPLAAVKAAVERGDIDKRELQKIINSTTSLLKMRA